MRADDLAPPSDHHGGGDPWRDGEVLTKGPDGCVNATGRYFGRDLCGASSARRGPNAKRSMCLEQRRPLRIKATMKCADRSRACVRGGWAAANHEHGPEEAPHFVPTAAPRPGSSSRGAAVTPSSQVRQHVLSGLHVIHRVGPNGARGNSVRGRAAHQAFVACQSLWEGSNRNSSTARRGIAVRQSFESFRAPMRATWLTG